MIFQQEIKKAKDKSISTKKDIESLRKKKKEVETWIEKVETAIDTHQIESRDHYTWNRRWEEQIESTHKLIGKIDDKIKSLENAKFELDFWILQKEEKWGRIRPDVLEAQIRQIYQDAKDLSWFILGRPVPIAFDLKDEAPLGYVPVSQDFHRRPKKQIVFLSKEFIEDQTEHLGDLYRALLIHELGHLLLHLGPKNRRFWKFRRDMIKKIDVDSVFFQIFNVLLDEQLERILRDVKPEWRSWFNRLEFYARGIDLLDLKKSLASIFEPISGDSADPRDIDISWLEEEGYIKTYDQNGRKFATILSSDFFLLFWHLDRPFVFYYALRHPISRKILQEGWLKEFLDYLPKDFKKTLQEGWLKECLDYIPKEFKSLDLFSLHRLAMKIYERMQESAACLTTMASGQKEGDKGNGDLPVAGRWKEEDPPDMVNWNVDLKASVRHRRVDPPPDPEGEPPPPRVKKERVVKAGNRHYRGVRGEPLGGYGTKKDPSSSPLWNPNWNDLRDGSRSTDGKGDSKAKGSGRENLSAKEKLAQKLKSGNISAKEKSRLRKEIEREERLQKERSQQKSANFENIEDIQEPEKIQSTPDRLDTDAVNRKLNEAPPAFNPRQIDQKLVSSLNKMLNKVRKEQEKKPIASAKIRQMTSEEKTSSDFKNIADTLTYPEPRPFMNFSPIL